MLPASDAPAHVPRVRAHRHDDQIAADLVLLDARSPRHDVRGQVEHALERAGCYGGHRRSSVSSVCVLAETNLTGERPFHTRIQETPATDTKAKSLTTQTGEDSKIFDSCGITNYILLNSNQFWA